MAWSYNIDGVIFNTNAASSGGGVAQVTVSYNDGAGTIISRSYSPDSLDTLKTLIKNELNRLANQESLSSAIPTGNLPDLTTTPPTQTQIDIQNFQNDYATLQAAQRGIASGLFASTNSDYQALLTRTKNEFTGLVTEIGAQMALTLL